MARSPSRRREIARLLYEREREGLTLRELSERSGIAVGTLSWWAWKLRHEPREPLFAEVRAVDDGSGFYGRGLPQDPEVVIRRADGAAIELRGSSAERVLERLLVEFGRSC